MADLFVRTVTWTILINPLRALINLDSTEPHDGVTLAPILDNIHTFATSLDANPGAFMAAVKADPAPRRAHVAPVGATDGVDGQPGQAPRGDAGGGDHRLERRRVGSRRPLRLHLGRQFDELYLDSVLKNVKALGRALCVSMERNMPELLTHTGGKYSIDKQEDWMKVHADRRLGVNDPSECCFAIVKAIKEKYAGGKEENLAGVALAQANGTFNRPRSPA